MYSVGFREKIMTGFEMNTRLAVLPWSLTESDLATPATSGDTFIVTAGERVGLVSSE